jgi:hypothetical protein
LSVDLCPSVSHAAYIAAYSGVGLLKQNNMTALMHACKHGRIATARLLLVKGADVEVKNKVRRDQDRVVAGKCWRNVVFDRVGVVSHAGFALFE